MAIESGTPIQTAEGLAFYSHPTDVLNSPPSLKKWRKRILSVCQSIGGSLNILYCQMCKQYTAGAFIFCSHCSEDGHPIRVLHGCVHKSCWCNDDFFMKNCQSFTIKEHIALVCAHGESKPYHGYPFVSPLECIVMLCMSNYRTRLQNCQRSDLLLNAIHCEHTNHYHSMSISMPDCWELQPDLARNNYCYEYDHQLKKGIESVKTRINGKEKSYHYNNRELKKCARVHGDLALQTREDELLKLL